MKSITITRERAEELGQIYWQETGHEFAAEDALYLAEMLAAYILTLHMINEDIIKA